MTIERECKIPVPDARATGERLRRLGAESQVRHYERNWVFDTADQSLFHRDVLLRLRTVDGHEDGLLTVKGPAANAAFKSREEIEVTVDDAATARTLLAALGYTVVWYYEKRRESLDHFSGLGYRTIAGAYYDADDLENPKGWLAALDQTPLASGIMYTTWLDKYELLGAFGDLVSGKE